MTIEQISDKSFEDVLELVKKKIEMGHVGICYRPS